MIYFLFVYFCSYCRDFNGDQRKESKISLVKHDEVLIFLFVHLWRSNSDQKFEIIKLTHTLENLKDLTYTVYFSA